MSGYFGTEKQQKLQALAEASVAFINATPGACQTGRMMGCDDPDRFGWDCIDQYLNRDGVFGFRMLSATKAVEVGHRLAERNCRFDTWDVFLSDRANALQVCETIVAGKLADGLTDLAIPTAPESPQTRNIQTLMGSVGVVPFSGSFLAGEYGPVVTVAIGDFQGNALAAAHGYLPHNGFSAFHRHAWGGLVAVAESHRGMGLGSFINARMVTDVFARLGATHICELVSATNIPSRRMVESCGLSHDPSLVCAIATLGDGSKFTR
jgi:Acetyltransferase (GNAT) family